MDANRFREHILGTYFTLRASMAVSALAFPLVLWVGGNLFYDTALQPSMSAYYHTDMGDVFVGVLVAIGASLTVYKGYGHVEDRVLDVAGVLAVAVALIPTETGAPPEGVDALLTSSLVHGTCALGFFAAIAWVCIMHAKDTLELIPNPVVVRRYRYWYRILGILMIAAPVGVAVLIALVDAGRAVFWSEAFAVWVFGAFWLTKTLELWRSGGDRRMLTGTV